MKKLFTFILLFIGVTTIMAQDLVKDTTAIKQKKNTIRWNLTPMMINVTNVTLGYERIIKENQSISINAGLLLFPEFLDNDSLEISYVEHGNRIGFSTAIDYRFYLKTKNLNNAPEGVYIGPYITYYQYAFNSKLRVIDNETITNDVGIDANFKMLSLGFELGYQFLFWDRLTLDMILVGPSLSFYHARADFTGELGLDVEDGEYIKDALLDKYPWLNTFMDLGAINASSATGKFGMGFRYVIQVGYHF